LFSPPLPLVLLLPLLVPVPVLVAVTSAGLLLESALPVLLLLEVSEEEEFWWCRACRADEAMDAKEELSWSAKGRFLLSSVVLVVVLVVAGDGFGPLVLLLAVVLGLTRTATSPSAACNALLQIVSAWWSLLLLMVLVYFALLLLIPSLVYYMLLLTNLLLMFCFIEYYGCFWFVCSFCAVATILRSTWGGSYYVWESATVYLLRSFWCRWVKGDGWNLLDNPNLAMRNTIVGHLFAIWLFHPDRW